jgi:hypothetical protein
MSIDAKLAYLKDTKDLIKAAIIAKGMAVPANATFRSYSGYIAALNVEGRELTSVSNSPWYNPGTGKGGISWVDPTATFDYIEITDLVNPSEPAVEVQPGVQHFEPGTGLHQYRLRAVFHDTTKSPGVILGLTTYYVQYSANLVSAIITADDPQTIVLTFDNVITASSAAGLSVTGTTGTLTFVDQPSDQSVRIKLTPKVFVQGRTYSISYDGTGTLKESNDEAVGAWTYDMQNNSTYNGAHLTSAIITADNPRMIELTFDNVITVTNITGFSVTGLTDTLVFVAQPSEHKVRLRLANKLFVKDQSYSISYDGTGTLNDVNGEAVAAWSLYGLQNNSNYTITHLTAATIPLADPQMIELTFDNIVTVTSVTGFSVTGLTDTLAFLDQPDGYSVRLKLSSKVFMHGTNYSINYDGSGTLKDANGEALAA